MDVKLNNTVVIFNPAERHPLDIGLHKWLIKHHDFTKLSATIRHSECDLSTWWMLNTNSVPTLTDINVKWTVRCNVPTFLKLQLLRHARHRMNAFIFFPKHWAANIANFLEFKKI